MEKDKILLIWDVYYGVMPQHDAVVYWQSYVTNGRSNAVSIPQLVEDNFDYLKSKYLKLIYDLGEASVNGMRVVELLEISPGFSYWWMTLLSEKNNYHKSPQINNIIKMMALDKYIDKGQYCRVLLVSSNEQLSQAFACRSKQLNIKFSCEKVNKSSSEMSMMKHIYAWLPYPLQAIFFLIIQIYSRWSLKGVGVNEWRESKAKVTFVSYLCNLKPEALQENSFESYYWNDLLSCLDEQKVKTNWLHIYVKNDLLPYSKDASAAINKFNKHSKGSQLHATLYSFLSIKLILNVLKDWYRLCKLKSSVKKLLEKESGVFWPFFKCDYYSSMIGKTAINNLLFLHLFKKAMSILPPQSKGFYLKENQTWEFAFINAWTAGGHDDSLIGVPHTSVLYWDLRYFFYPRTYMQNDKYGLQTPNKVAINGEKAKKMYLDGGYPSKDIVEVEALRYLYLNSTQLNKENFKESIDQEVTILILSDYLRENVTKQMVLIEKSTCKLKNKVKYILKPHPACPILSDDYPRINFEVTNEPIHQLLDSHNIVFTSNVTSAAVDAYYMGKIVISFLDPELLNMSPLKGVEDVLFVSTFVELADILNSMDKMKNKNNGSLDYFYLDKKLTRWRSLLVSKSTIEKQTKVENIK